MYKLFIRPILFSIDPEKVHHLVFKLIKIIHRLPAVGWFNRQIFCVQDERLSVEVATLRFPNPVGLAAGFDKDGKLYRELSNYGFGFIEVGTVTPRPQAGNPRPRLFRLPADRALINRMGFNNEGVDALKRRLRKKRYRKLVIGGNIGKNKDTPNEEAVKDYLYCFRSLYEVVDYFVVNVSSPNTPGLRSLQEKAPLLHILKSIQEENHKTTFARPVFLKIAPDLTDEQLRDIIEIVEESGISGIIATNTTISRDSLQSGKDKIDDIGAGGLSGMPLKERSTAVIRFLSENSGGKIPIIAAGGIFSAEDAEAKLKAGASLVQIYTGFIYEGPALIKEINKALLRGR